MCLAIALMHPHPHMTAYLINKSELRPMSCIMQSQILEVINMHTRGNEYTLLFGAGANLEVVDKFCYLGEMLSVDGDADAAVEARIRIGWKKFRQLVPLLTSTNRQ